MRQTFSHYLGAKRETGFNGYIAENNIYITIESDSDLSFDVGNRLLHESLRFLQSDEVKSLTTFNEGLTRILTQAHVPEKLHFVAVYVKDPILYIKTVGRGAVHLVRGHKHAELISGDANASGQVEPDDLFILATHEFIQQLNLDTAFRQKELNVMELVSVNEVPGAASVFLRFDTEVPSPAVAPPLARVNSPTQSPRWLLGLKEHIKRPYETLRTRTEAAGRKKLSTLVAIIILTIILIWSVGLASRRRNEAVNQKNIQLVAETIQAKLAQADEVAFLNLPSAMTLIKEAKSELGTLKESLGQDAKYKAQINQLEENISEKENSITRKEEKASEEFFDFAVDTKGAAGTLLYREGDRLEVLDTRQGALYELSLTQKSLDKNASSQLKSARLMALASDVQLVYIPGSGVFSVEDNSLKKRIPNDPDWGSITAISSYNGNIYLLDGGKASIYKYVPVEDGYSDKQTYLADGEDATISGANSMAIDSSVYVATGDGIVKFTSGLRDGFSTDFPDRSPNITKVIAHNDLDNVYIWDKTRGTLYILAKNGTYEKEIQSSVLKQALDVTVYNNAAYALIGSKLYKILL